MIEQPSTNSAQAQERQDSMKITKQGKWNVDAKSGLRYAYVDVAFEEVGVNLTGLCVRQLEGDSGYNVTTTPRKYTKDMKDTKGNTVKIEQVSWPISLSAATRASILEEITM